MMKKIFFLIFIIFCFNIFSNADSNTSNTDVPASDQNISASKEEVSISDLINFVFTIGFIVFLVSLFTPNSDENTDYNVFVILDNNTATNVENISKKLKEIEIESLYAKGYLVHLTLYLTKYNSNKLSAIKEVVNKIANQTKPFDIEFYKLRKTDRKLLVLDAKNNENIQQLSDEITVNLTKYHTKNTAVPDWITYIPEKKRFFKLYGSPDVFTNFEPYITLLTQANSFKIDSFVSNYDFKPFKTKVISIGIAKANNLGQVKDIIYSKSLENN